VSTTTPGFRLFKFCKERDHEGLGVQEEWEDMDYPTQLTWERMVNQIIAGTSLRRFEVTVLTHLNDVVEVLADNAEEAEKMAEQWADDTYPTAVLIESVEGTFMEPKGEVVPITDPVERANGRHPAYRKIDTSPGGRDVKGGASPTVDEE
jgi:hypothetical protein